MRPSVERGIYAASTSDREWPVKRRERRAPLDLPDSSAIRGTSPTAPSLLRLDFMVHRGDVLAASVFTLVAKALLE